MPPPVISDPLDSASAIERDVLAIKRISTIPGMLKLLCENTGMGFAAVARVTDHTWTACAVEDRIAFGLAPGGQLKVETTLCREARAVRKPIVIDQASLDPVYKNHHTPRIYGIESYVSVPIVRPDGRYFGNLCAIDPRPAQVSDAKTVRMFTALADMIALELGNEEGYEDAVREAHAHRETAEVREQFIAVLGHDLRNPLQVVGATAELLARRPEEALRVHGERLRASAKRMGALIDNLLDLARARLGSGINVEIKSAASLAAALAAVVDEMRIAHPEVDLREHIEIGVPVACDTGRLQQLLSNLLGNAFHHGAKDEPVVVDAVVSNGSLEVSVCNGGACIAETDLAKIFLPYWRPVTSKPGGGLGLGLYICSEIVKAHGGQISATSSGDHGTRFVARIPLA